MFALLISMIVSAAAVAACVVSDVSPEGTVWAGIGGFLATQLLVGLLVRKKFTKIQNELQEIMLRGQKQLQWKVQQFQSRPGGNIKQIQRQIESDQKALMSEALVFTDRFEPLKKWSPLMGRQIATMRFQFLYQLKKFEEVDPLLASAGLFSGPILMEPLAVAMKMARQYKNGDIEGVEKTFKRRIKWFRGARGTLLYGVMSWIYVKEDDVEKAHQLLIKAKDATGDETIARNLEMLANNKVKHFSNAGLGEEWYGLYLENPPAPKQQRVRGGRGGRPF